MDIKKIRDTIEGQAFSDEETLRDVSSDFGRILVYTPKILVLPASAEDVGKLLRLCYREGWPVSIRGAGHSQSGQSLSRQGVLLDISGLNRMEAVEGDSIWVESGVLWSDLVRYTAEYGVVPPVLTNNLDVTVGGTLSTGGLGVASHQFGTQVENVEELEVVTGEGHLVRCSPAENEQLFHAVRCGLGQFGVITRCRLRLRRFPLRLRTHYLLYDDIHTLMKDQLSIMRRRDFDYVESWCSPCPQGFHKVGDMSLPFAEWFYPMHLTGDADRQSEEEALEGLSFYRKVHVEEVDFLEFVNRLEPVFSLWRESGAWNHTHPWMECLLPWSSAAGFINGVLKSFPPHLLLGGHVLLWPCRSKLSTAPLFKHPKGDFIMGFGILCAVPRQALPRVLPILKRASDLCMELGGKRYLSGWIEFDQARWQSHFGDTWPKLLEWKNFYDPKRLLNPHIIDYEGTEKPQ